MAVVPPLVRVQQFLHEFAKGRTGSRAQMGEPVASVSDLSVDDELTTVCDVIQGELGQVHDALTDASKDFKTRLDQLSEKLDGTLASQAFIKEKLAKDLGQHKAEMEAIMGLVRSLEGRIDEIKVKQDMGNQNLSVLCHLIAKLVEQKGSVSPPSGLKEVQLMFDQLSTGTFPADTLN